MAKRRGLGINNASIEAMARDAEREHKYAEAKLIRQQMTDYRHIQAQKKLPSGKIRRYKNLATFNRECKKRGQRLQDVCELTNIRKLADGSGLATIRSVNLKYEFHKPWGIEKRTLKGTWLIHFASHNIMKRHLKGRVEVLRKDMLDGRRR